MGPNLYHILFVCAKVYLYAIKYSNVVWVPVFIVSWRNCIKSLTANTEKVDFQHASLMATEQLTILTSIFGQLGWFTILAYIHFFFAFEILIFYTHLYSLNIFHFIEEACSSANFVFY